MEGLEQRIALAERTLRAHLDRDADSHHLARDLRRYAARGTDALRSSIEHAEYPIEVEQRLSTAVGLAGRLVDLCVGIVEHPPDYDPSDLRLCAILRDRLRSITTYLAKAEKLEWIDLGDEIATHQAILLEVERTVDLLADSFSETMWEPDPAAGARIPERSEHRIWTADAFANADHFKFAVRGALSAILCYMLYMSVGWTGLNASIATCILTALPVTGAARHKQLLRFAGVVLGACVLGFAIQILVLPQIDSILSYSLLFGTVLCLGAWIATSGPRIAFCGVQIVLAYEIVNLGRFSLTSSLIPARDTVLGIGLGIGAMWLIFDHLWVTPSTETIRGVVAATIRKIAALSIPRLDDRLAENRAVEQATRDIIRNFDKTWSMIEMSMFEALPRRQEDEVLLLQTKEHLPQLRAILMIKSGLVHHAVTRGGVTGTPAHEAMMQSRRHLIALAERIEAGQGWQQSQPVAIDKPPALPGDPASSDETEERLASCLRNAVMQIVVA